MDVDRDGFADLVQQANQLTADMDSGLELPRVNRNLHQILEAANRMASRVPHAAHDGRDIKASLLLGSRGYDIQKASQKLEGLSSAKTFEPLEPIRDTDIQGFLKNERENALLAAIEQARKNTFEETEKRHWDGMLNEWEREKQKILNALVGSGQDMLDIPPETESMLSDNISMQGRSTMDNTEMAYARQIYIYNESVVQGGVKPSLTDLMASMSEKIGDQNITELWSVVQHMTDVPLSTANSQVASRNSVRMTQAFVSQALKYLQSSYHKYISSTVYSNLQQAQLGGVPGTFNLVRSFLNIKLPSVTPGLEDGQVEGHPVWAMIYYCLRCGDLDAAWQVISSAQQHLGDFPRIFEEYMKNDDRRLSINSEREIKLQYRRAVRNCTDPYKRVVFCVLGRCDPRDDHTELADTVDDYLWVKLCQLSPDDQDNTHGSGNQEALTLSQLQSMLLEEFGESHFSAYQQPFLYFRVLMLTGQFEAAIEFLARLERLRCHAVHTALVLYELKMLLLPPTTHTQLLCKEASDPDVMRRLNFVRLVTTYTRKFEMTDPREALQYFYFLRDIRTSQGDSCFMSCVSELVLETREFDMLLGQLVKDGSRKPGAIDKFQGDTQKVIEMVARDTENKGLFEDAVRLYDLADKFDKVIELLNKLLCQVVSQPPNPQSTKDRLRQLATGIAERYRLQSVETSLSNSRTFHLLLDLMTFFDFFHGAKLEQAYSVLQQIQLLPFTLDSVEQKVKAFSNYADEIRRSLPDILLAAMNILQSQYKTAKNTGVQSPLVSKTLGTPTRPEDGGKQTYINYLRSQARALITFAGMIPYRMPGDTNARLVQMEVLMN